MNLENPVKKRKTKWPKVLLVVLAIILAIISVFLFMVNRNLVRERDQKRKQEVILSQLPGQACGVLSPALAKATIGEPVKQAARNDQNLAYEDGCTYTNPNNSSQYATLVIKTYSTNKDAADGYAKERSAHIQTESRDPGQYGDEMYYTSGNFYVLRGNRTFAVGAAKPGVSQQDQEAFSKKLLDNVTNNL